MVVIWARTLSGARFRELIASAPPIDADFAADLDKIREAAGPPREAWHSC